MYLPKLKRQRTIELVYYSYIAIKEEEFSRLKEAACGGANILF
jgi:hypothetical protein